ncbi:DUF365 domain-containing protein [Methanoculleus bourgensis]|uniref:DUF365 domain-containing protein n=1 Tax=Methanoculleus bourgensis TaxID=83986 RepID=A0A0X3BJ91_9EURY|nr:protein of unknown function [Methanoculleus bourgensis]
MTTITGVTFPVPKSLMPRFFTEGKTVFIKPATVFKELRSGMKLVFYQSHEDTGYVGEATIKRIVINDNPLAFFETFGDAVFLDKRGGKSLCREPGTVAGGPGQEGGAPEAALDGPRTRGCPKIRYGEEAGAVCAGRGTVPERVSPGLLGNEDRQPGPEERGSLCYGTETAAVIDGGHDPIIQWRKGEILRIRRAEFV